MRIRDLAHLDFQLAYLVLLTRRGVKPLSRWEKPLDHDARDIIAASGLQLAAVPRRTAVGRTRTETVFSLDPRRVEFYARRFAGARLRHTPPVARLEGRLFGYPSCCVDAFVRRPYAPNGLPSADQEILFHWACPGCVATPGLLREYRRVHAECLAFFRAAAPVPRRSRPGLGGLAGKVAASVALVAGAAAPAAADDPHWLPVADDADHDFLTFAEEVLRGTDWENQDTDGNLVLDGVQAALMLRQLIAAPPPGVVVTEHPAYGLETCAVCGLEVNMGFVRVAHPQRGLAVDLPFVALHYLEHGGLAFDGSVHGGRVDLDALERILFPYDPAHLLPPHEPDLDGDGLLDAEEPVLGTDPEVPDSDADSVADGPQVAEGLLARLAALPREEIPDGPYRLEWQMDGVEQCEVCGVTYNMGFAEIVNPLEGLSLQIPYVALHTLAHGGFVFDGTENDGRVLPVLLRTVLTGDGAAHWLPLAGDHDADGLLDEEERDLGLDPEDPDEDGDAVPDGRELAAALAEVVRSLPTTPQPDRLYAVDHLTFGFYTCLICGEEINMGFREIVDPVGGDTLNVPFYNLHFMEHGSFSTDRDGIYPRADPRALVDILGITPTTAGPSPQPPAFALQAWPNPFHGDARTTIALTLPPDAGPVSVTIVDAAGRRIRELAIDAGPGGATQLHWDGRADDGSPAAAGTYVCRVRLGGVTVSKKLTVIR